MQVRYEWSLTCYRNVGRSIVHGLDAELFQAREVVLHSLERFGGMALPFLHFTDDRTAGHSHK
jgi:hypothetical protein